MEIKPFDWSAFWFDTNSFFGLDVYNLITFAFIFFSIVYIYNKVFKSKRLPILKDAIVYLMMLIGSFALMIFQVDADLPIVYSLSVAIGLMAAYQIRVWLDKRKSK
jgi:hypothetical protein